MTRFYKRRACDHVFHLIINFHSNLTLSLRHSEYVSLVILSSENSAIMSLPFALKRYAEQHKSLGIHTPVFCMFESYEVVLKSTIQRANTQFIMTL